ncbi:MAG TPA: hypothetical protein VLT47_12560 [Anaeromyxobacteraceae bacterium]|nr:hypothetical protein [Anaeromyxobacteraceae bacterium]
MSGTKAVTRGTRFLALATLAGAAATAEAVARAPQMTSPSPVALISEVPLPGRASRFDYQDVDERRGHLIIAHMGDDELLVVRLRDGVTVARLPGIRTVRGVRVAEQAGLILATAAATDQLVRVDAASLSEIGRTATGSRPDGVDYDPVHRVVGVSDQRDGALSLISDAGGGPRRQVRLGVETGNVVFDPRRERFWITVVAGSGPDRLVAVDPASGAVTGAIDLAGCAGAHGLRLHPDGASAYVACEENDLVARVGLSPPFPLVTARAGAGPDVLALDPGLGRLYVAAERGDLFVFDTNRPGLALVGRLRAGDNAHTVAVDPGTHRLYLPLPRGRAGGPVLQIGRSS